MKQRIMYAITCLVVALVQPVGNKTVHAVATEPVNVVILAVQTGQVGAAGNDFIELYNRSATTVDVTGWKLQYRAATSVGSATWTTKRTFACTSQVAGCTVGLAPYGHLVVSTYDVAGIDGEQPMASGMSDVGGQVRLVQPIGAELTVHDAVGYGTAAEAEEAAAPESALGETLVRHANGLMVVDSGNNAADFIVVAVGCYVAGGLADNAVYNTCLPPEPEPQPSPPPVPDEQPPLIPPEPIPPVDPEPTPPEPIPIPPVQEEPPVTEDPPTPPVDPPSPPTYAQLYITELLPDPASPATDADDEYVELYNPSDQPVVADGYVLETGLTFTYHFTLSGVVVPAGGYVTVLSAVSHVTLSNTAGAARLLDPSGAVIDQTAAYDTSHVGQTWAKILNVWQWTLVPTPAAVNQPTPVPPVEEEPPITPPEEDPLPTPGEQEPVPDPEPTPQPISYPRLIISELLPDPASPALDSTDEFIELFNPNAEAVNVSGYTLQAGSDFRYKFVIPNIRIEPGGYAVVASAMSHLSLSNSGTTVQLLNPNGEVVDTVASYGVAKVGQSWARLPDGWYWTTTATPGGVNKHTVPPVVAKVTKALAKKATTTKTKTKTTPVAKVASAKSSNGAGSVELSDQPSQTFNYLLLAPVGLLVVGYVIYEYRQNIARWWRKITSAKTADRPPKEEPTTQQMD